MRVLWSPQRKQADALRNNSFELLFGGAAGGGKSDFLLADFVSNVNDWRDAWRGVLFRRTYPELETIIARAKELYLPLKAAWNKTERTFIFPTGSKLQMRFLESDDDVTKYQGQEYTWIGFDELGNYPSDYCWKYMMSRLRSSKGAPCYIRGTANPGGRGHSWIKNRFIDGLIPGKIYRIGKTNITRCFIPSKLQDNTILLEKDPDYMKRLEMLPEYLRRALLDGDWDIFAGQVFDEWRRERHVIKPFALPQGQWYKFYAFDWGYNRPYALVKLAVNGDGKVIQYGENYGCDPEEMNKGTKEPARNVAAAARADAIAEGVTVIVCDPAVWGKDDDQPSPGEYLEAAGFIAERAKNDRVPGWLNLHEFLKQTDEYGKPMLQVFETCHHTIRTLPALTPDRNRPEDVDSKLEDHLADALRYGLMSEYARYPGQALRRMAAGYESRPRVYDVLADNGF
jgi:hypothetical protein